MNVEIERQLIESFAKSFNGIDNVFLNMDDDLDKIEALWDKHKGDLTTKTLEDIL